MANSRIYYFIDINLISKKVENHGESKTATHEGNTDDPAVHRVFISKGQYNKLAAKFLEFQARNS